MNRPTSVTVDEFFQRGRESLELSLAAGKKGLTRPIQEPTVNRPGLVLAGFTRYFPRRRLQVMGSVEMHYLKSLAPEVRDARLDHFFGYRIPGLVLCRGYKPDDGLERRANKMGFPILRTPLVTMKFINLATLLLEEMFVPSQLVMGSMVDILGIGVIIRGESGIGKSECVLELIERGYSLVSDDVTRIALHGRELVGTAPPLTRDHMEVRGIGIINVPAMFGIRSIRNHKRVDLVVDLVSWEKAEDIERVGMESKKVEILGAEVPVMVIPVRPGRDLARLVEVAAFHTKLLLTGYNPAQALEARLIKANTAPEPEPSVLAGHNSHSD